MTDRGGAGTGREVADASATADDSSEGANTAAPVLEARGLRHEYPDGTVGLDGVDLTIRAGERVAIVGPNGSGKSTLQLVLGGLIESAGGDVTYFGETTDAEAVRQRLGVLLQDPDDYLFNTTVREDLEYGPAQLGVPQAKASERIDRLAADLGLAELLDRPPFQLSGGEKQRAALASVLAFDPEVLLLDEPISAIDGAGREQILDLLDAQHGRGKTLVFFTPNLELVPRIADRLIVLAPDGTVAADGSVREILTDADLLAANDLRPPAVVRLFDGIAEDVPLTVAEGRRRLEDEAEGRRLGGDAERVSPSMRVKQYLYDSETGDDHVEAVLDRLAERDESVELQDVAADDDRADAIRDAMLTLRDAVRIGSNPDEIYDADGRPDFSPGVLITEESTGRRNLHIGSEALEVLDADDDSD